MWLTNEKSLSLFRKCEFVRNKGRVKDNPAVGGGDEAADGRCQPLLVVRKQKRGN